MKFCVSKMQNMQVLKSTFFYRCLWVNNCISIQMLFVYSTFFLY